MLRLQPRSYQHISPAASAGEATTAQRGEEPTGLSSKTCTPSGPCTGAGRRDRDTRRIPGSPLTCSKLDVLFKQTSGPSPFQGAKKGGRTCSRVVSLPQMVDDRMLAEATADGACAFVPNSFISGGIWRTVALGTLRVGSAGSSCSRCAPESFRLIAPRARAVVAPGTVPPSQSCSQGAAPAHGGRVAYNCRPRALRPRPRVPAPASPPPRPRPCAPVPGGSHARIITPWVGFRSLCQ